MKKIFLILLIFAGCATTPPLDPGYETESEYVMLSSKGSEINLRRSDYHAIELFMQLPDSQFVPLPCKLLMETDTVNFQYTYDLQGIVTIWYEGGFIMPRQVLIRIVIIR